MIKHVTKLTDGQTTLIGMVRDTCERHAKAHGTRPVWVWVSSTWMDAVVLSACEPGDLPLVVVVGGVCCYRRPDLRGISVCSVA